MEGVDDARNQWKVLNGVLPLFSIRLPTTISTGDRLETLNNEITKLRTEINILKQVKHQIDFEHVDSSSLKELMQSTGSVTEAFETLIDDRILSNDSLKQASGIDLSCYPRIRSLLELFRQHEARYPLPTVDVSAAHHIYGFIHFPEIEDSIASTRRVVQRLNTTVDKLFADKSGRRVTEAQIQCFTKSDAEVVQNAFHFASTYARLFCLIESACGERHQAKLYLYGSQSDQLRLAISTCQEYQWIPAIFKRF
jgi:hypothetical protein